MAKRIVNLDLALGALIILVFIGLSHIRFSILEHLERYVYDAEMRYAPSERRRASEIVLIHIDDKTLSKLGPWPWPRLLIAEMIDKLKAGEAKLIALNMPFIKKQANQGLKALGALYEKFEAYPFAQRDTMMTNWMQENLKQMEKDLDSDKRLVESVKNSRNVVLPVQVHRAGPDDGENRNQGPFLSKNFMTPLKISRSLKKRHLAEHLALPFPELAQNVLGLGHGTLVLENAMAGRTHPMLVNYSGSLLPSFPLRLAIAYLDQKPGQVFVREHQIRLKGYAVPLTKGEMLVKFHKERSAFAQYPFVDILHSKELPAILKGKIVIVGFNSRESKGVDTPVSPQMSEGEFIANIVDNIINRRFMRRPPFMGKMEILAILLLGGAALYMLPRRGPLGKLVCALGLIAITLFAGFVLFFAKGIWFKTSHITACLVTIYLMVSLKGLLTAFNSPRDSIETDRLLGLSYQSQGLLDLAFDKFRRLPFGYDAKELIYNLGREYERRRKINEALSAYEYIYRGGPFRDLDKRIPELSESASASGNRSPADKDGANLFSETHDEARTRIGRYDILEQLGKGSMGKVYKALDPKINRLLAIKTIRFSDEFEEDVIQDIRERFFREAEIAGQLSHPSIVTIFDVGDDGDLTYMAMEFLEGVSLEQHAQKGNLLPFRKILDVMAMVADALYFAHRADVIHRDIKPANIMLLNNGGVKVTDFGIAKAISSSRTKTGEILGTPNYMSPEQIMGQRIDLRSDIFSLGVLFFQLLIGQLPFRGQNVNSLLHEITQVKHPSVRNYNPKLPRACDQILDKALAKDPKDRFKSAAEIEGVMRVFALKFDELKAKRGNG
jgi:serine/threonine-protein kinase